MTHAAPVARAWLAAMLAALVVVPSACAPHGARAPDSTAVVAAPAARRPADAIDTSLVYTPRPLEAVGSITGDVTFSGTAPSEPDVQPLFDTEVCGNNVVDDATRIIGDRVTDAIVWLSDARSGKRLPLGRRYELVSEHCRLDPRVQPVIVGGTLNVRNEDAATHRTRFLEYPSGRTLALVRQTDFGQVVPVERVLNRPGQVMIVCDVHPWTRAWLLVFNHPYVAMTNRRGAFVLDSVPPGRYHIVAWHERLGMIEDSVVVEAGRATTLRLTLPGQ